MDINRCYCQYNELFQSTYFIDKSELLVSLNYAIESKHKDFCFSFPSGFGKTQILNMCEAYFSREIQSKNIFDTLKISKSSSYLKHLNNHNIIVINMFQDRNLYDSVNCLIGQLCNKYNIENIYGYKNLSDLLNEIMVKYGDKFICLIDNYDYFFYSDSNLYDGDRKVYLNFLKNFIFNQEYFELVLCFGINEIKAISADVDLLKIKNYSLINLNQNVSFFGFNKNDVDKVYQEYSSYTNKSINRNELYVWYGGYYGNLYNCNCVIKALNANKLISYNNTIFLFTIILSKYKLSKNYYIEILNRVLSNTNISKKCNYIMNQLILDLLNEGFLALDENGNIKIPNKECHDAISQALLKLI